MTQESLRSVTLATVANTARAAENAVGAYRVGGHRLVSVVRSRVTHPAADRAEPYAPRLVAALRTGATQMGDLTLQGLDTISDRTGQFIDAASNAVTKQVKALARVANDVDNRLLANGLDAAARAALPGAQIVLNVSERIADGTDQLQTLAAGSLKSPRTKATAKVSTAARKTAARAKAEAKPLADAVTETVTKAARSTQRSAKAAPKAVSRATRKAAEQVDKAVAKPVRRASKAVAAAAESVEEAVSA